MNRKDDERRHREILRKYARRRPNRQPMFCQPSRDERDGRSPRKQGPGTDGKPIYDGRENVAAAIVELEKLYGLPLREYICNRSRHGHFHITTDRTRLRQAGSQRSEKLCVSLDIAKGADGAKPSTSPH